MNDKSRGFQFIHIEAYSLRANQQGGKNKKFNEEVKARTVSEVTKEALRADGFCNHVSEPEAPKALYGDLSALEALCVAYHQNHKNFDKNGKAKALRSDANVLLAGVISLEGIEENYKKWDQYKADSINYLKEKYGDNLACVVEHTDEENPHLHFYVVPHTGQKLDELHDGKNAVLQLKNSDPKALKGKQNKVYVEAMRAFQNDFYNKVSLKHGLTLAGPARSRVSRKIYFEQKKAAELYAETHKQIEENKHLIEAEYQKAKFSIEQAKKTEVNKAVNTAYNRAVRDFQSKNYVSKMVFSIAFNKSKIERQQRRIKHLIEAGRKAVERKNLYKKKAVELAEYKSKFENLRRDFDQRVERKIEYKNKDVLTANHQLKKVKLENEYLKEDLEKASNAVAFMQKLKQKLGKNFREFEKEILSFTPQKQAQEPTATAKTTLKRKF